jgi:hypothetical protein
MMESSSAPVARPAPAGLDRRRWWALALLCGAFFMVLLDGTITIVALPSIGADLGFSKQDLAWVLSPYAFTFGGLLLLGGRAADLQRRDRVRRRGRDPARRPGSSTAPLDPRLAVHRSFKNAGGYPRGRTSPGM